MSETWQLLIGNLAAVALFVSGWAHGQALLSGKPVIVRQLVFGAMMGIGAAHPIVIYVFEATWRFDFTPVLAVAGIAVVAAATGGAAVGWSTLSHRPARVLRSA